MILNNQIHTPAKKKVGSARAKEGMFQIICVVVLSLIAFCQMFPFFLKLVDSLHTPNLIPDSEKLYLWPEQATIENYLTALQVSGFWEALGNTAFHSVMFTAISLCIAIIVGSTNIYPNKKTNPAQKHPRPHTRTTHNKAINIPETPHTTPKTTTHITPPLTTIHPAQTIHNHTQNKYLVVYYVETIV